MEKNPGTAPGSGTRRTNAMNRLPFVFPIILLRWALLWVVVFLAVGPAAKLQAAEANKAAIALLIAKDGAGKTLATGTGFVVDPEGTLVTNYHVLVDALAVEARFIDGTRAPVKWVLKVDRKKDFAILKLGDGFYSTLELGDSTGLQPFDYTSALGYLSENGAEESNGKKGVILQTFGFVLGVHPQAYPDFSYIYTSTPFGPGFSGGPLVNKKNQVLGIATVEGRSLNLALPINEIKPFLKAPGKITLKELFEQDKLSKEALYYKGNFTLYALGNPEEALRLFDKALALDPQFVLAHYDRATALRDQGLAEQTTKSYEEVVRLNPRFPEALSNLGGFYFRDGQIEKAVQMFQQAIAHYPNFIQAHSNLGAALNKLQRPEEALVHLKKTIDLAPEFAIAHYNLGNAYFALNRWDDAIKAYEKSVSLGVDFLSLHWKLYEIHHQKGDPEKSKEQLKIILQIDPEDAKAKAKLAELSGMPSPR